MLPVFVSVPHGGTQTPPEIADRVALSARELFDDGDAFTREVYDLSGEVSGIERAEIARAFVDLNRAPDDRPPANPDGVVKTATAYGVPVYERGQELTPELSDDLIARHHAPYHARLATANDDPSLRLALDCHSMAAEPPPVAPDAGRPRPLFCLSNGDGVTCPAELLQALANAIATAFEVPRSEVALNDPFKGGYITRTHGRGRLPWVQVEMNRSLYLAEPWFDAERLTLDPARIGELRERFLAALRALKL